MLTLFTAVIMNLIFAFKYRDYYRLRSHASSQPPVTQTLFKHGDNKSTSHVSSDPPINTTNLEDSVNKSSSDVLLHSPILPIQPEDSGHKSSSNVLADPPVTSIQLEDSANKSKSGIPSKPSVTRFEHPFTIDDSDDDKCPGWTKKATLFPNERNKVKFDHDGQNGVVIAQWEGTFPTSVYFPYEGKCVDGIIATEKELTDPLSITSMLCTYNQSSTATKRTTVVLNIRPEQSFWLDQIEDNFKKGLDLLDFHSQFLSIWMGFHLIDYTVNLMTTNKTILQTLSREGILPSTLSPPIDVVFLFPDQLWSRFSSSKDDKYPIVVNEKTVRNLVERGGQEVAINGMKTVQETLAGGQVIVASESTTLHSLRSVLHTNNLNERAKAWMLSPNHDQFLSRINSHDKTNKLVNCRNSILQQYADNLRKSKPVKFPAKIARHSCLIVSRQITENSNSSQDLAPNLNPELFSNIMKGLAYVIVITPSDGLLHDESAVDDGLPLEMDRNSIIGQLRFVHEECAVLGGFHEAGLVNLIGMRPGTHVLEFKGIFNHTTLENLATLMNNVSYSTIQFDSVLVDEQKKREGNFSLSEERLNEVIELFNEKVQDSIQTQKLQLDITENA